MQFYSFGQETVPVAFSGDLVVGSVKKENYEIMLAKINGERITDLRFFSGSNDWEGHAALKIPDGYIIGGAVEGRASPQGGEGWKAYIARLDNALNILWERKFSVNGNDAVYSIIPSNDGFVLGGETNWKGRKGFFLAKVMENGDVHSLKILGPWEDVLFTNMINSNGIHLIGSIKEDTWKIKEFLENTRITRDLGEGIALSATNFKDKTLLTGYHGNELFVSMTGEWTVTLGNGTGTTIVQRDDEILVGGELNGSAIIAKLNLDGELICKKFLWSDGWIEIIGQVALGIKNSEDKVLMGIENIA